jgi:hypothetical protein
MVLKLFRQSSRFKIRIPLGRPRRKWENIIQGLKSEGMKHVRLGRNPKMYQRRDASDAVVE